MKEIKKKTHKPNHVSGKEPRNMIVNIKEAPKHANMKVFLVLQLNHVKFCDGHQAPCKGVRVLYAFSIVLWVHYVLFL